MEAAAIRFRFLDAASAQLAFDTLEELGYEPVYDGHYRMELQIHVEKRDLTSAIEIAEVHSGTLVEAGAMTESAIVNDAYNIDLIPIPAHVINEDWADDDRYAWAASSHDDLAAREEDAMGWNDDTNQFPGGIHI
ncbi:hypothetical protein [Paenibacillus popilliae]|uniref:DNA/RNA helicase n=1 Tax=Paenibacillus popilliae ATCC 14706 TaxID=1212764 RepID=M9LHF5_PAEPP|nr:hypothetical protein [Paenibacillus popilliae]GAC42210.1 DNA/RNA helicase [Paenibacillus popilliae ATCC 14706]